MGREVSPLLRAATIPGAEVLLPFIASRRVSGKAEAVGRVLKKVGLRAGSDLNETWRGFTRRSIAAASWGSSPTPPRSSGSSERF